MRGIEFMSAGNTAMSIIKLIFSSEFVMKIGEHANEKDG